MTTGPGVASEPSIATLKQQLDTAISERDELQAQQVALAEVLQAINDSPGDLGRLCETIIDKALALCDAAFGILLTYDGEYATAVAMRNIPPLFFDYWKSSVRLDPTSGIAEALRDGRVKHVIDLADSDAYRRRVPHTVASVDIGGIRTVVWVPLVCDRGTIGLFSIYRKEVRPFTKRHIALVEAFAAQAVIAIENARLLGELSQRTDELSEALKQQTATADVLKVISRSTFDLRSVLHTLVESAARLCEAEKATITRLKDGVFYREEAYGFSSEFTAYVRELPVVPGRSDGTARALQEGRTIHIADVQADPDFTFYEGQRLGGFRTVLAVPMLREGQPIGAMALTRSEVRPFTDKQIEMVSTFADQAVIAIENARLITETREALERQTATTEVLQVINSSPGDLRPVFDMLLEKAMQLCGAAFGHLDTYDGTAFHTAAIRGASARFAEYRNLHSSNYGPGTGPARMLAGECILYHRDLKDEGIYRDGEPNRRALVDLGGARSALQVALRKDDALLGFIILFRQEVRPFTDRQGELLQNFAAQAVIAMENARLLTEQGEALEQQTATAEVLGVINSSPGNLAPVFETILEKSMHLCEAAFGILWMVDGNQLAQRGVPPAYADYLAKHPVITREAWAAPGTITGRILDGEPLVHVEDLADDPPYRAGNPYRRALVDLGGARTALVAPLRKDASVFGFIMIYRQEARLFSDRQAALLQNFAAQAVIAMENARLLTEQREALERQTATAEVLQVINSSPGNLAPVFDAILEKAHSLCDAPCGSLQLYDGSMFRAVADRGLPETLATLLRQGVVARQFREPDRDPVQVDMVEAYAASPDDPVLRAVVKDAGLRTVLFVPLHKEGVYLGRIVASRRDVRPFTDKQVALLQNFAAQAVIAMENARLLTEQREALEQQTATAEVLQTINGSPGDLQPVFDAILGKAMVLCEAAFGILNIFDGRRFQTVAARGVPEPYVQYRLSEPPDYGPDTGPGRLLAGEDFVHVVDMADSSAYRAGDPNRRAIVNLGGARSNLAVALRKENKLLGMMAIYRKEVRPFSEKQIALVQNFAAQAVIAMENARLLGELRDSTRDLQESLKYQTATSDVLKVISRSTFVLQKVLDTLVESAVVLCEADIGTIRRREGNAYKLAATFGFSPEARSRTEGYSPLPSRSSIFGQAVLEERTVHIPDILADPDYARPDLQRLTGFRAALGVLLRREGNLIGTLVLQRFAPGPFTPRQIELVETFADQAVIAMENARLLSELTRRQQELSVTFEHMGDGVVMFDADLRVGAWNRNFQELLDVPDPFLASRPSLDDYVRLLVRRGEVGHGNADEEVVRYRARASQPWSTERTRPDGRTIEVRNNPIPGGGAVLIYGDITERKKAEAEIAAARDAAEEALERQTATADILRVIASSPSEVQPVFDAIAERSNHLIGGLSTAVYRLADDLVHLMSFTAVSPEADAALKALFPMPLARSPHFQKTISTCEVHRVRDAELEFRDNPDALAVARLRGYRSRVTVPLIEDGQPIGLIGVTRAEPGLVSDQHVELLKTFADQAVIAIRNARLFSELREALEQQTATADILRVISQSPTDVTPVLAAVAKAALKFCGARDAQVVLRDGDHWFVAATEGPIGVIPGPRPLNRHTTPGRAILDGEVVQIADVQSAEADEFPESRNNAARLGFRSALAAPLLRDDVSIGAIALRRPEPGAFTPNQVELLKSFAAQAVIAIENVRLFNELRDSLERLKAAQANLIQSEKMASLGQLTAGIAHEIKNPLNFVNNFAGLSSELLDELKQAVDALLAEPDEDKRAELQDTMDLLTGNLAKIVEHGRRADGIVKSMLTHSRGGTGDWQTSNINSLVEEALNLAYHGARAQDGDFNVALERDFEDAAKPIDVVPQDVTRVFLNLFGNGFYAARKRHREETDSAYRPTLRVSTRDLGEAIEVRVRDNGIGIADEVRTKLFQPFFTTKPTGEGTGLGLSISYDIVTQQHGGTLEVESELGSFTEFTVRLPRRRRVAQSREA